jgi:hypothetical protein
MMKDYEADYPHILDEEARDDIEFQRFMRKVIAEMLPRAKRDMATMKGSRLPVGEPPELHDAVERRWLASYTQLTKERKEYLLNCELKPTSQEKETICKSKQEFDAFVSKYMEQ